MHTSQYLASGSPWPWSYGSWIYNYLCNQYLYQGEVYNIMG